MQTPSCVPEVWVVPATRNHTSFTPWGERVPLPDAGPERDGPREAGVSIASGIPLPITVTWSEGLTVEGIPVARAPRVTFVK